MVKTYHTELKKTPVGDVRVHFVYCAGSCNSNEKDEVEVWYECNCGKVIRGVSINGHVFHKEDILEIARRIKLLEIQDGFSF